MRGIYRGVSSSLLPARKSSVQPKYRASAISRVRVIVCFPALHARTVCPDTDTALPRASDFMPLRSISSFSLSPKVSLMILSSVTIITKIPAKNLIRRYFLVIIIVNILRNGDYSMKRDRDKDMFEHLRYLETHKKEIDVKRLSSIIKTTGG